MILHIYLTFCNYFDNDLYEFNNDIVNYLAITILIMIIDN